MEDKRFAVLIDADNISNKYAELIFKEASNYGNVKIKRIYGDWSKADLASWRDTLLDYSITPVQQFNYTTGKNSTDSAIIIDAMDILFSESVDGFCLVTSDSDFTRLVTRMRESDMYVVGMGEKKTPQPLVRACSEFKYLDAILKAAEKNSKPKKPKKTVKKKGAEEEKTEPVKAEVKTEKETAEDEKVVLVNLIKEIIEADAADWLEISYLDALIKRRRPDFDFRVYGYKKMVLFFESLEPYGIMVKRVPDESNHKNFSHKIYIGLNEEA